MKWLDYRAVSMFAPADVSVYRVNRRSWTVVVGRGDWHCERYNVASRPAAKRAAETMWRALARCDDPASKAAYKRRLAAWARKHVDER